MIKKLRKHQLQAREVAEKIVAGIITDRNIIAAVTPGGGKSLMAAIFANTLIAAGFADFVVAITPNQALRKQLAEGFHAPEHGCHIHVRELKDGAKPAQGDFAHRGYVATCASVVKNIADHVAAFTKKHHRVAPRVVLVIDEAHHLSGAERAEWARAIESLSACAVVTLRMTGTLARHDKLAVAGVVYEGDDLLARVHIRYTRAEALEERAILPTRFRLYDGKAVFEYNRHERRVILSEADDEDGSRGLRTILTTPSSRNTMVAEGISDWLEFCEDRERGYESQCIVVVHSQESARGVKAFIESEFPMLAGKVALAISEEPDSHKAIKAFRMGPRETHSGKRFDYRVLVTVAMAYEGLDAKWATHLICLHDTRSWTWLDQCVNRVTRFNPHCGRPWEHQWAYVFMPADKRALNFVDGFCEEQEATCRERAATELAEPRGQARGFRARLVKLGAEITGAIDADSVRGVYTPEQQRCLDLLQRRRPDTYRALKHMPSELLSLAIDLYGNPVVPATVN